MKAAEEIEVRLERIDGGIIVRPIGDIDRNRAPSLRIQIEEAQVENPQRLILDLAEVPFLDSSVVAVLVETVQRARCGSGIVILCGLSDRVRSVFEVARLDKMLFTIVRDVREAIAVPNRRRFPRCRLPELNCDLGQVVDISADGVRLSSNRQPQGRIELRFWNEQHSVSVAADVVWSHRSGFRRHELGLRFVGLSAECLNSLRLMLSPSIEAAGATPEDLGFAGPAIPAPG